MTLRVTKKKWILYRHIRDFGLLCSVAKNLKSYLKTGISKQEKINLNLKLKELGLYRERNQSLPLDAINHKINQLSFYMFGYQYKKRFLFSPLGNLFLKHIENKNKTPKIFLTMLWSVQFQHPHSGTNEIFQLYPFRLVFKLLIDTRLSKVLYAYEISHLIVFIEKIDESDYEKLVREILELRKLNDNEIKKIFIQDKHVHVNAAYEWDYYVSKLLESAGVLSIEQGNVICKLQHGNTQTFRKITRNRAKLNESIFNLTISLEQEYSLFDSPILLNDSTRLKIDTIKEIYNFYPKCLLEAIGEPDSKLKLELLKLPKLIEQYSNNNDGKEAYLFEDILEDGFNMFYNIKAEKIGGAGNTDLECLYITKNKKFAVDAKSTKNKLSWINSGRLDVHRKKIGGDYTIVITPRYVPAVLQDIYSRPIVIIQANTFSEFLYNCIDNNIRDIDYSDFDNIIASNLGNDISSNISNLTIEKFATKSL